MSDISAVDKRKLAYATALVDVIEFCVGELDDEVFEKIRAHVEELQKDNLSDNKTDLLYPVLGNFWISKPTKKESEWIGKFFPQRDDE